MNLPAVFESHFGLNLGSQIPDDCLFVLGLGLDVRPEPGKLIFPDLNDDIHEGNELEMQFSNT